MQTLNTDKKVNHFTEAETEQAFQTAKQMQLPVLIDFWAPGCKGCKKMDLTTYQNSEITGYIDQQFVFVKYNITSRDRQKIASSPVLWTPCFVVYANDGSEVRKTTGYITDEQFRGEMEIGRALALVRRAQSKAALELLENLIANNTNESIRPEAMYWAGVAAYFLNKRSPDSLVPFWEKLMNDYPASTWASKANCLDVVIDD